MPVFCFTYPKTPEHVPEICVDGQYRSLIGFRTYHTNEVFGIGQVHLVAEIQGVNILQAFRMLLGADGVQIYSLQQGKLCEATHAKLYNQYLRTPYSVWDGDTNHIGDSDVVRPRLSDNGVIVFRRVR